MSCRTNWALGALLAGILTLGSALDGPHDLDVAQAMADDHTAVQQAKLALP